jgi:hypothetical protein
MKLHVLPEIWMTLSLEDKIWLLSEKNHQQQEDEKVKNINSLK